MHPFCLVRGEAAPMGRFRESSRAHGVGEHRERARAARLLEARSLSARPELSPPTSLMISAGLPEHARDGMPEAAGSGARVMTIRRRMLTTVKKGMVTMLTTMLTRVLTRILTRMGMRMVTRMRARMLVKTVTMLVMRTTARGQLSCYHACGDGDDGQGAMRLSARAPSRSFVLMSERASILVQG